MMETKQTCTGCRKTLPPRGPLGLCPECLIKAGFNTGTEPGQAGERRRFDPPAVAALAPHFPQLEILEFIGQGGMGAVYKARQTQLDRLVALKILPPGAADDAGFTERFNREARALARLNHPHIVAVHDFGQANGQPYLVMEFVDGSNLRQVEQAGRLTPAQALEIVPQICEALQFAHGEGIVHRDIKPENILLDKKGRVKITDFGIAKILGVPSGKASLTGAKDIIGTPHYMAPEQVEHPQTVDHRADIFSLGVVFYELLTGELPLGRFQPPSRKVQLDVRLDEVVLHALEKEPDRRYQHASEVKTDVEKIASSGSAGVSRGPAEPPAAQVALNEAEWSNSRNWTGPKWLSVYFSKRDSRVWVAKQIPALGRTVNLGRGKGAAWLLGTFLIVIGLLFVALVWVMSPAKGHSPRPTSAAARVTAVPPVVITTIPESGAAEVDPALAELRVTFSKPMQDGRWSWSAWGEENKPQTTGEPKFLDGQRTCVLPVQLQPGKVYALWINSEKFKNFTDREGRPALPYLLIFETRK